LNGPLIVNFRRRENSFLTIVVEAIEERVTSHEIVRRELRFDVRLGDDAPDADVHPLEYVWDVEIKIDHRHIETVVTVVLEQLIAEKTARSGEAIIEPIEKRDAKTPVDVIALRLIRQAFYIENDLV
jgi:hypothetical protein